MGIDPNRFFQEMTFHFLNSLDIEQSLNDLFNYLKRFLPLDHLSIGVIDKRQISVHYMAEADSEGGRIIDEYVQHSEVVIDEGIATFKDMFRVFNDWDKSPYCQSLAAYFGIEKAFSMMVMTIDIGGPLFGFFGIMAFGKNRYRKEHVRLLQSVDKLISNHVSHLLHHWEIMLSNERLASENKDLWKRLGYASGNKVVGSKLGLKDVMKNVEQVASLRSPVLLIGETGVGKEIIAKAVHYASDRAQGPMISVNCGAIPETLLESELFGYEKGAFTGATRQKKGYFERANNGTIFLDEIAELSLQAQVKLLRVLQDMKLERIGGSQTITVDTRIVAATNRDLPTMIKEGRFREELWFRLNVFPIRIPPLKERTQDIPELLRYFASRKAKEMNLKFLPRFAPEAIGQLQAYDWPGNVRELQNVIERAIILHQGELLSFPNLNDFEISNQRAEMRSDLESIITLDEVVVAHIRKTLVVTKGRIEGRNGAAELLGMKPSTLRGRMRKLGVTVERSVVTRQ
ncbi:MAG: sigma-54-dependent Fis family transcriptional regulator [Proteobacteria bacterium]|nr:sigma-54-dependent Fis family transcriptional regulator [Pseudomonadota bacterium]